MIKRFSKLTTLMAGLAAAIASLLSPSVGLANLPVRSKAHQDRSCVNRFAKLYGSRHERRNLTNGFLSRFKMLSREIGPSAS